MSENGVAPQGVPDPPIQFLPVTTRVMLKVMTRDGPRIGLRCATPAGVNVYGLSPEHVRNLLRELQAALDDAGDITVVRAMPQLPPDPRRSHWPRR